MIKVYFIFHVTASLYSTLPYLMYTSTFKEQFFSSYLNGDYLYFIFY